METKLSKKEYKKWIEHDIEELDKSNVTSVAKEHIRGVLHNSIEQLYPPKVKELSSFEWETLWASMRYFCNRGTIASATFPSDVIVNYYYRLTDQQKEQLVEDLDREAQYNNNFFGHARCDNEAWQKFKAALDEEEHFKVELIDGNTYTAFEALGVVYTLESYIKQPMREIFVPKESIVKRLQDKTVYVLTSNGYTTYYRTEKGRNKDYVSQDHTEEIIVSYE